MRRIEIRKLPFFLPIRSKRAKFSAPPLLKSRIGLPPESSAIPGARLRASNAIFAVVPRTRTVSARCSPALSGEESASRSSAANVREKVAPGVWRRRRQRLRAQAPSPSAEERRENLARTRGLAPDGSPPKLGWNPRHRRSRGREFQIGLPGMRRAVRSQFPARKTRLQKAE